MYDAGEALGQLFVGFVVVIILAIVIGVVLTVVDYVWGYDLPDVTFTATITHLDIDDGCYKVSVESEEFTGVISVSSKLYAKLSVGDSIELIGTGSHSPISGDQYHYKIVE